MFLNLPSFTDVEIDFGHNLLHWWEIIQLPLYFMLLVKLGNYYFDKKFPERTDKKLFINGLKIKMLGGIFITLIFNLYYGGGDTNAYFNDAHLLDKVLIHDPATAIKMFLTYGNNASWSDDLTDFISNFRMATPANTWLIVKITAFFNLFCLQSMLCTTICFSFLAYLCVWRFYITLCKMYPLLKQKFAYAIIYVPSVIIWGSGIFKDTVTLSALLILFTALYEIFFERREIIKNCIIFFISGTLLYIIKDYILFSFLLAVFMWLLISLSSSIENKGLKLLLTLFVFGTAAIASFFMIGYIGKEIADIALKNLIETSISTGQYLKQVSDQNDGSSYDLGTIDPSIQGFVSVAPKAINVTLFRPYLWESKKVIIFFSALESTAILLYFIYVLLKNKIIFFFAKISKDPYLVLCFFFTLIFAVFVGISSFNFGSLVRYKIPCLPFFLTALVIIDGKELKKKVASHSSNKSKK